MSSFLSKIESYLNFILTNINNYGKLSLEHGPRLPVLAGLPGRTLPLAIRETARPPGTGPLGSCGPGFIA